LNWDVHPANQTAAEDAQPEMRWWLEARPREGWPKVLRGGSEFGNEAMMTEAAQRKLPYLFRLPRAAGVERLLAAARKKHDWATAGDRAVTESRGGTWRRRRRRRTATGRRPIPRACLTR
jgi:hypothetical protein